MNENLVVSVCWVTW